MRLLTGIILLLCASSLSAQDHLVLISPHWEGIRVEFTRSFSHWYKKKTGRTVSLDWRDMGGASDDLRFILSEFQQSPKGIGIDLFFGGGLDPFITLKDKNLLAPISLPREILDPIPRDWSGPELYDPDGCWYGAALSSFGILKNERVIKAMNLPSIQTWSDLAHPALKGWVGSADPRNSGSSHMVYECILQAHGWDKGWKIIQGISANVREFDRSTGSAAKSCTLGNTACALVVDFYGFLQIAEAGTDQMSMVIPDKESIINPDCIAMLKGAPNKRVATAFIEFTLSEAGQSLWLAPRGHPDGPQRFSIERMAIRPDLYEKFKNITLMKINPFQNLKPMTYNSSLGTRRWSILNGLLGAFVMDAPRKSPIPFPLGEEEVYRMADSDWKDPEKRTRLLLDWQKSAWQK